MAREQAFAGVHRQESDVEHGRRITLINHRKHALRIGTRNVRRGLRIFLVARMIMPIVVVAAVMALPAKKARQMHVVVAMPAVLVSLEAFVPMRMMSAAAEQQVHGEGDEGEEGDDRSHMPIVGIRQG